jgi:pimeloyl-ACP methyl ester carboxylesterase
MLLAVARPGAIAGVVLNDIGPVIETRGLARIKSYVGKLPQPKSYEEGADILRGLFEVQFPKLSLSDWTAFARRTFNERDGRLLPNYDVELAKTLDGIDLQQPLPPLWKEFDALARVPVMVVRGANSDILSAATISAMVARRPDIEISEIPDQGHAPFLAEDATIRRIHSFIRGCGTARQ